MEEIKNALSKSICKETHKIILSLPSKDNQYRKCEVKRIILKGRDAYQFTKYTDKQAFQENVESIVLVKKLEELFPANYMQMNIFNEQEEISLKVTKKGKLLQHTNRKQTNINKEASHNREKNYIIKEGTAVMPLVDMGVFTKDGKVVAKMYDKYKQINRFVEIVDDVLKNYNKEEIHIIDFGCGKSYLTFILYYYLVEIRGLKAIITGLDLKEDVINKCNKAAEKYGYENLHFEIGNIDGYKNNMSVDMVVTLHACDTATDFALSNAVKWNAGIILSVPCCQHELNSQIANETLAPMMKYGIIKERFAALATDSIRGCMLEYRGYKTQLMEFVDMAHSPKNILIRAVKANLSKEKKQKAYNEAITMSDFLNVTPTIIKELGGDKNEK